MIVISILLLVFLTIFAGYCSASETSLFSLSPQKIKAYQDDPDPKKRLIAHLLAQPRDLLVTVFMLNTFTNIVLQNIASGLFGPEAGWGLKVGVPLMTTLVLGEIVPKYVGLQNNLQVSYLLAPSINYLQELLAPIRRWVLAATIPISRVMFFFVKREKPMTDEEMEHLLEESEKQGLLQHEDVELIHGYLDFQDTQLKELMWPREDILFYDMTHPLTDLVHLFVDRECTRVPVCEGSLDNVVGIMNANHFFIHQHKLHSPFDLLPLLHKPIYVPETISAKALLRMLQEKNQELALIVNEYGTIDGLLAREDLIEIVIGQVKDLRDSGHLFSVAGENEVIASAKWELAQLNDYFDVNLVSPNHMVTIGGWLTERMGEIPKTSAKYQSNGLFFHVLGAYPNRITRLYIRKLHSKGKKGKL